MKTDRAMKKIIVTGAAGIIGAILTELLLKNGYQIYAVVRPDSLHNHRIPVHENIVQIPLLMKEIIDLPRYIPASCDAMIHLAWSNARNDFAAQYASFRYTTQAVDVATALGCQRFLGIGSQAEYGWQQKLTTEDTVLNPVTPYGAFKAAASHVTRIRAAQNRIEWIWGRIFSVYGGYEPTTSLISYLLQTLKQGDVPLMTEATQQWDYLYVQDAAQAVISLLEKGQSGQIYNIANGDIHPLRYFTEQLRELIAPDIKIHYGAKQIVTAFSLIPSVKKIQKDTGWKATMGFLDGIKAMLANKIPATLS